MAESIFLSLRIALNHAWGGIRSRFGRVTAPAKQEPPEADGFLSRLEEVLGIELQAVEPVSVAGSFVRIESVAQPATKPKPKRNASTKDIAKKATPQKAAGTKTPAGKAAATKAATRKKRTAQSASRRKSGKTTKATAAKEPAPALVPKAEMAAEIAAPMLDRAETPLKPAGPERQALGPQGILGTALVQVPRLKSAVLPANGHRAGHPLPDILGAVQATAPVYEHALQQAQAQTLADQPSPKQKKKGDQDDSSPFSVSVGQVYDGPLDLLLDLIRRQDIDIYDIPIATITAQFLSYVNQLKASDVDVAGEFIYTASLLIHIKSKMLLPRLPSGPDDAPEDPRRELVERLLEHERFKNAAQMLQQKQMLESATWSNPGFREFQDDAAAEPEIAADTVDLVRIFRDILDRARKRPVLDLQEDSVTVGQMIQFLARRLSIEDKPVALRRLLSHTRSERALVAMFLALLELVRLQAVLLRQDRAFSEIFIKKHTGFDAVMNDGAADALDDWR